MKSMNVFDLYLQHHMALCIFCCTAWLELRMSSLNFRSDLTHILATMLLYICMAANWGVLAIFQGNHFQLPFILLKQFPNEIVGCLSKMVVLQLCWVVGCLVVQCSSKILNDTSGPKVVATIAPRLRQSEHIRGWKQPAWIESFNNLNCRFQFPPQEVGETQSL